MMDDEFCPECGAKITGTTGFCSECGATTTSLKNKIEESTRANEEEKQIKKIQKNYYSSNKSNAKAILLSILLPFSGNLYLKENVLNFILTIISLVIIFYDIFMLLTLSDTYSMFFFFKLIFPIWWIISIISLIYIILMHNRYKTYYADNPSKYSKEGKIQFFNGKNYIIILIAILFILFVSVNLLEVYNDSPKYYDGTDFSIEYPHSLHIHGDWFNNKLNCQEISFADNKSENQIVIKISDSQKPLESYVVNYNGWGSIENISVDKNPAFIVKNDNWHTILTIKNNKLYEITFVHDGMQYTDSVMNSFKFK